MNSFLANAHKHPEHHNIAAEMVYDTMHAYTHPPREPARSGGELANGEKFLRGYARGHKLQTKLLLAQSN